MSQSGNLDLEGNDRAHKNSASKNLNSRLISLSRNLDLMVDSSDLGPGKPKRKRESALYVSGSSYCGKWDKNRWDGNGVYIFPHGVSYTGTFHDSQFHGNGVLKYPLGHRLQGEWRNGKLISWRFEYDDGLQYTEPWDYCQFPSRTYNITYMSGAFRPPDQENITNLQPPRKIPAGCYDVGEGFYNPHLSSIVSATEANKILRIPTHEEIKWIEKNCRYSEDRTIGYRPDLYEYWCSGSSDSVMDALLDIRYQEALKSTVTIE